RRPRARWLSWRWICWRWRLAAPLRGCRRTASTDSCTPSPAASSRGGWRAWWIASPAAPSGCSTSGPCRRPCGPAGVVRPTRGARPPGVPGAEGRPPPTGGAGGTGGTGGAGGAGGTGGTGDLPKAARTAREKAEARTQALGCLVGVAPGLAVWLIGPAKYRECWEMIVDSFQDPTINRHVVYSLWDLCLELLYPEMSEPEFHRKLLRDIC
uniref:Polyketide hydroxylase n=1 Tax=Petromyzon marinus TaxID=7757 RepID=A0AAJ7XIX3_PETMA